MKKIAPLDLDYLACAFDPSYFMYWAYGVTPEPWQDKFLKDHESSRILFVCTRQGGKSTTTAGAALFNSLFHPNRLSIIIAPGHRQSKETFKKVLLGYEKAARFCGWKVKNMSELELTNGSRIIALPGDKAGDKIRGYSAAYMIIIEEASRVTDEAFKAVKPIIAASPKGSGKILALSTPFGQRGFFYNSYLEPDEWVQYLVTAKRFGNFGLGLDPKNTFECERITEDYIKEEIRVWGEQWVRQEYYCEFTASEDQVFSHELIMQSISSKVPCWNLPMLS